MKDQLDNILNRQSIRSFSDQEIKREDLEKILKAAEYAPTGRNQQPLFFVLVSNQEVLNKILSSLHLERNFYGAKAILFSFAREDNDLNELNLGAAIENALLEATDLGISSCWIHNARHTLNTEEGRKVLQKELSLDQEYEPMECIALGYLKGDRPAKKERNLDGDKII